MNTVKKPETIITLINTAALLGASIYFYKKIQNVEEDLNKHSEHLTFTVKQTKELIPLKAQMTKVAAALREINTNMTNGLSFQQRETEMLKEFVKFQNMQISELYSAIHFLKGEIKTENQLELKHKDNPFISNITYGQVHPQLPQPQPYNQQPYNQQPYNQQPQPHPRAARPEPANNGNLLYGGYPAQPQQPNPQPSPQPMNTYPPQQPSPQPMSGYPPQQPMGSYPPQQPMSGYSPQQPMGGYPPQQPMGGYPPQQPMGGYPPQFGGYPQQPYNGGVGNESGEEDEDALINAVRSKRAIQQGGGADSFFNL